MNGFTPEMFSELSDHLTRLDQDGELWVGLLTFANGGARSTALRRSDARRRRRSE